MSESTSSDDNNVNNSNVQEENEDVNWTFKLSKEFSSELTDFVLKFINEVVKLKIIDKNQITHIELTDLIDSNGLNILMRAVDNKLNLNLINELLHLPFDINQKSNDGRTAADIAWQKSNFVLLLRFLEANSTYPNDFNVNSTSNDIVDFLAISENLHNAIKTKNLPQMSAIIKENSNLIYFYNSSNISAATIAMNENNFDAYEILLVNNCSSGPNEDFNEILEKMSTNRMKMKTADIHSNASKHFPERYLMIHYANIVVAHDDRFIKRRVKYIKDFYELLNEIPLIRQILQLTAMHKNFKIHFDFNRSSVHFMNPFNTSTFTRGLCEGFKFKKFHLYVAAKELLDDDSKFASIGTLAHELCHFAMHLIFFNDANPYAIDDCDNEMKFNEIDKCQELKDEEMIVSRVFDCYDEILWPSELIVRVPQMIAHYSNNSDTLNHLKDSFKILFDYFDDVVTPKMTETEKMLEKLFNNSIEINYNDLTDAYKAKIYHSKVNFQAQIVKFNEIIEDKNSAIYQTLTSAQIRGFLLQNMSLIVGFAEDIENKFYIDRSFIFNNIETNRDDMIRSNGMQVFNESILENVKNFDEIADEVEIKKIFLLSDFAGAGKTTTFKRLAEKLKKKLQNYWISYVDLKRHLKIYQKYEKKIEILDILLEILYIEDEIDVEIFKILYNSNKVILFFDGLDEIAPKFKEFFIKFIQSVRNSTDNQQWISTRPQHAEELSKTFHQKAYKLLPYDEQNTKDFIKNYLKFLNVDEQMEKELLTKSFMSQDNPLMLQMFIELYINDNHANVDDLNIYELYEKIIEMKVEVINDKGEVVSQDRDNRKSKVTIWEIHQIYALKLLYPDGFKNILDENQSKLIDINDFSLLKKWQKTQKSKWTPEAISRYGLLTVDNWNTADEFSNFIHRTFAEYFVTQFLIENIYELDEDDDEISDKEVEIRFKLLIYIPFIGFSITVNQWEFMSSFIDSHKPKMLNENIYNHFTSDEMRKNFKVFKRTNLVKVLSIDERFLKEFKFVNGKTIFQEYVESENFNFVPHVADIYEKSLGVESVKFLGYSLRDENNFTVLNDKEIDAIFETNYTYEFGRKLFNYNDPYMEDDCKKFLKFLFFIECIKLPRNILKQKLHDKLYDFLNFSFRSAFMVEKLMKIFEIYFHDAKEELCAIIESCTPEIPQKLMLCDGRADTYIFADRYVLNIVLFCDKIKRFFYPKILKYFRVEIFAYFCSYFTIVDLSCKYNYCEPIEIQEFFIENSAQSIECIVHGNIANSSTPSLDTCLRDVFLKYDNGREHLILFFKSRYKAGYSDHLDGHSVFSYLIQRSKDAAFDCEPAQITLINLAHEVGIDDSEIEALSNWPAVEDY